MTVGRRWGLTIAALLLAASASAASGSGAADSKARLEQLRERISKLRQSLESDIGQRNTVTGQLRDTEEKIGSIDKSLHELDQRLDEADKHLNGLRRQQTDKQKEMDAAKAELARQIRAAYRAGREERIKLLLNQEDPDRLQRMLTYYDYLNRARAAQIETVRTTLTQLQSLSNQITEQVARMKTLREQRSQALASLEKTRRQREAVVRQLEADIHRQGSQLDRMKADEKRLSSLVKSLQQTLSDIPADLGAHERFARLKGRLPWPADGRLLARYGQRRPEGRLDWHGVLIGAPAGAKVRAVSYGRVAFAGWLPHYGLVAILEHGEGYLTLYAHNQSIYRQVGDWVQAGEVIATVGESGGETHPGLYFEIRHGRKTLDPDSWCGRLTAKR
ncbi:MAG: peptidoglycan DD-metalloendopeptidase family protein [Gammaproteobacteria bacterium]|jgi:septal ring factor EnvC (AmiA/AmiB activator)